MVPAHTYLDSLSRVAGLMPLRKHALHFVSVCHKTSPHRRAFYDRFSRLYCQWMKKRQDLTSLPSPEADTTAIVSGEPNASTKSLFVPSSDGEEVQTPNADAAGGIEDEEVVLDTGSHISLSDQES